MHTIIWLVLIISLCLLILTALYNKNSLHWLGAVILKLAIAVVLLYLVNWFGAPTHFHIGVNEVTIAVVGMMGIPGLLLLFALKLTII